MQVFCSRFKVFIGVTSLRGEVIDMKLMFCILTDSLLIEQ